MTTPIRWKLPSAWAKECSALWASTPKVSLEMKSVPEVPREMLHMPSPMVPVPTAAAALSPAPATIFTVSGRPSSSAISFFRVPTTSYDSKSFGSCSRRMPQMSSIFWDQHLCCTSKSSRPEASE